MKRAALLCGFAAALLALTLGSGCASHCGAIAHFPTPPTPSEIRPKTDESPEVVIFRPETPGPARPILLLHELPGLNECTAAFAARLAHEGFTVYAPVMVGHALEPGGWARLRNEAAVMLSPDWPTFSRQRSPAVLGMLRTELKKIRAAHPDAAIGVIGMCMSGTLSLALLSEEHVSIAAICQPALPLKLSDAHRRDLGLAPADRDAAVRRIQDKNLRVLGYRFESDAISTPERMVELAALLGDHFTLDAIGINEQPEKKHSAFTFHYNDTPGSPTQVRFRRLVAAFTEALRNPP